MSDIEVEARDAELLDLSIEQTGRILPPRISVDGRHVALDEWEKLLRLTDETGKEHGLVVSTRGGKKGFLTSRITEGYEEEYEHEGKIIKVPAFRSPAFPHGLKSLLPGVKEIVEIHTHPIMPEDSHLTTTGFSDWDIEAYVNSSLHAYIMIDRGGVHMLTGRGRNINLEDIVARQISASAIKHALGSTKSMAEVRTEMARSLSGYGINYYFSPNNKPSQGGRVQMTKL